MSYLEVKKVVSSSCVQKAKLNIFDGRQQNGFVSYISIEAIYHRTINIFDLSLILKILIMDLPS